MSLQEKLDGDRRRAILRLISTGGESTEVIVLDVLRKTSHGFRLTRARVRADFDWLRERHLIDVEMLGDTLMVATITDIGEEVLVNARRVAGVSAARRRDL
ncbi:MAG: hypothetical protein OXB97_04630 [Rhodospirillales bacterium]|nr:hypothetical protein [Rhodospirillales bacterium]